MKKKYLGTYLKVTRFFLLPQAEKEEDGYHFANGLKHNSSMFTRFYLMQENIRNLVCLQKADNILALNP